MLYYLDSSALIKRYAPEAGMAWILSAITFVTADTSLLTAAQSEGMSVEDPSLH